MPLRKNPAWRRGFTLIEVLVGVTLIALMGVLIVQLVTAATRATQGSNRGIDTASQVRLVFERLDLDLAALANRQDVDFVATNPDPVNATGTAAYSLAFLTNVTSALPSSPVPTPVPSLNRGVSLVSYQIGQYTPPSGTITPATSPRCLLRASKALLWTDASPFGIWRDPTGAGSLSHTLPIPLLTASPAPISTFPVPTLAATDFDVVAPAVIRMVVGFQLYPDTANKVTLGDTSHTVIDPTSTGGGTVGGQIVYAPPVRLDANGAATTYVDLSRVSAIIVGLVAVDPDVVKRLTDQNIKDLAVLFPTPSSMLSPSDNVQLPVGVWAPIAADEPTISTKAASVPMPARQSLRVFQRAFSINPYGSKTLSP